MEKFITGWMLFNSINIMILFPSTYKEIWGSKLFPNVSEIFEKSLKTKLLNNTMEVRKGANKSYSLKYII